MQTRSIIFMAVLVNLLFSYLMLLYNQPVNVDGILYIHAAQAYLKDGLQGAAQIYAWPFYPVLMAKISTLFHLSLLNTGYILNGFFTSILIIFFILALNTFENSPTVLLWGAAVILLFPALNHDRYNIVRDIGYYAFFMASLWGYIKFLQTEKFIYALFFIFAIILASLFRIEGIIFLILIPVITLVVKYDFKLILINIILSIAGIFLLRHHLTFGRIPELIAYINPHQLFAFFQPHVCNLKNYLGINGQDDACVFLLSGLAGILIVSFLTTYGIFSSLLLAYGIKTRLLPENKSAMQSLIIYIVINIIILAVFLLHQLFMNWRYVFPVVLISLLFLPGILVRLNKLWIGVIYLLCNTASSFGQFGPSNSYIVDAGQWVAHNTPPNTKIYASDITAAFYAERTEANTINKADYIIIINKIHSPSQIPFNTQPVVSFHNKRGDTAYIFKHSTS